MKDGPPEDVVSRTSRSLPEPLVAACRRATARRPDDRYPSAQSLADDLQAWLDGARTREQAQDITDAALARRRAARSRASEVGARIEAAEKRLADVAMWESEEVKAPLWEAVDRARADQLAVELDDLAVEQDLQGALRVDPLVPDAHAALAERYLKRHVAAVQDRDDAAMSKAEARIWEHIAPLAADHPTRAECMAWLEGAGALTLVTDPPGAEVELYRYVPYRRRLVEERVGVLGQTPLVRVPLAHGSYLCVIRHPDCEPVRYPVWIPRQGHWDGVPPGATDPKPVWLPPAGYLAPDEVYVPEGVVPHRRRQGGRGLSAEPSPLVPSAGGGSVPGDQPAVS